MKNFAAFLLCLSLTTAALKADEPNQENQNQEPKIVYFGYHKDHAKAIFTKYSGYTEQELIELCKECKKGDVEACGKVRMNDFNHLDLEGLAVYCKNNPQDYDAHLNLYSMLDKIVLMSISTMYQQ